MPPSDSGTPPEAIPKRVFLLSPAKCTGVRAQHIFSDRKTASPLVERLRRDEPVSMGEVFAFMSGLYFRGKLAYAEAFAQPPAGVHGVLVITPDEGLRPPSEPLRIPRLRRYAAASIDADNPRYRRPLARDARRLKAAAPDCEFVLLGSIASDKYVDVLLPVFGERLHFPAEFVGRGDMSRGGLLLRCVRDTCQLSYTPLAGAVRHGVRPARLAPLSRTHRSPAGR
jgi:hypothetical protein